MRKLAVSFLLLMGCASICAAQQTFVIKPAKVLNVSAPLNKIIIFDIFQQNVDKTPISLGWKRIEVNLPAAWDFSMCDFGTCYAGIPDTATMFPVDPDSSGFLGLNIIPNGQSGTGQVKCYVFDTRFPENGDTVTWNVSSGISS